MLVRKCRIPTKHIMLKHSWIKRQFKVMGTQTRDGGGIGTKSADLNKFLPNYGRAMKFWVEAAQAMHFQEKYMRYPFLPFLPFWTTSKRSR